ncbi:MAG: site-2 protease family protein [Calditrichia bacterium]
MDYVSHLKGILVYRAKAERINDTELSRIIARLIQMGIVPQVREAGDDLLLYIHLQDNVPKRKQRLWLHLLLFLLTIFSTMMAGAIMQGADFFSDFSAILSGWTYSFALMTILTAHEMGHYWAARFHQLKVTLPYYLPLPIPGFHFGTLGAFIKIKSPLPNKPALLDVGASGPLAGFFFSLLFLIYGYATLPDAAGIVAYVEKIHPWNLNGEGINLVLGKSLLFWLFNDVFAGGRLPMNEVYHFPFIFAGWIGLLVTSINLLPIGQLDGGHILYALVGKRARVFGVVAFALMLVLNVVLIIRYFSFIWVLWVVLILFVIGFRHPPTLNNHLELGTGRKVTGWVSLMLFVLCFSPLPIYIS